MEQKESLQESVSSFLSKDFSHKEISSDELITCRKKVLPKILFGFIRAVGFSKYLFL